MSAALVLLVAAGLAGTGLLIAAWRPDPLGAAAGLPVLAAAVAIAGAGFARYATVDGAAAAGQELAVVAAIAGFALVALISALLGAQPGSTPREEPRRRGRRR